MSLSKYMWPLARVLSFGLIVAGLTACASPSTNPPRVFFTSPTDGATVSSPVKISWGAENFIIEPAGEARAGAGHLHLMVDTDCLPAGEVIPKDETHLHFGQGQLETELDLSPGTHTLCVQAGDGTHVALAGTGMTQKITISVK